MSQEETAMQQAIEQSLKEHGLPDYGSYEPLNPEQRLREEGTPVGIKNVGNTCYFNSLLQTYFLVPKFIESVLKFVPPVSLEEESKEVETVRKNASINLVKQLQKLFAYMIRTHRKYIDPSCVLNALVDEYGIPIEIGDQKDVGEFNMILLARIEEGMKHIDIEELRKSEGKLTAANLTDEGIVSNLFYGKHTEIIHAKEHDGTDVFLGKTEVFGQVMVDVEEKDLYSAWDKAYFYTIDEYTTETNFKTSAQQEIWIEKLPDMLLFQIQRVKYDKETAFSYKIHKPFHFPKAIYPDRFMHKNKELSSELRGKMLNLKKRTALLGESIEKFQNYHGLNTTLDTVLSQVAEFLSSQNSASETMEIEYENLRLYSPENIETDPTKFQHLEAAKELINKYASITKAKRTQMLEQFDQHNSEIEAIFSWPELKEHPYHLHSILVHDGQVGSGHYYTYIYDTQYEIWRKFNDMHVSIVPEEQVMCEAVGGNGMTSAYSLVYINSNLTDNSVGHTMRSYSIVTPGIEVPPDEYGTFIPLPLLREVDEDNTKLKEEISEYKLNGLMKRIQDMYTARYHLVSTQYTSTLASENLVPTLQHELVNFNVWLKLHGFDQITKWHLLDLTLRECDSEHRGIMDLTWEDPIINRLGTQLKVACKEAPEVLILTDSEIIQFTEQLALFRQSYYDAQMNIFIIDKILEGNFVQASQGVTFQLANESTDTVYSALTRNLNRILLLRLEGEIVQQIYMNNQRDVLFWGWHIVMMVSLYLQPSDIIVDLLKRKFIQSKETYMELLGEGVSSDFAKEINDIIEAFDTGNFQAMIDCDTLPEEIVNIKENYENSILSEWAEGWKKGSVASLYAEALERLATGKIVGWVNINKKTLEYRAELDDFAVAEAEVGIDSSMRSIS